MDRLVWYAGWADKYRHVVGNLNPVSGPFFNMFTAEPTGVVGVIAPEEPVLLGLVSRLALVIVSGNTAVVLASERRPVPASTFSKAMATADVPGGVVNILTGSRSGMLPYLASHLEVNAIDACGADPEMMTPVAAGGVKRVVRPPDDRIEWRDNGIAESPYLISAFTEVKTVWHPKGL